MRGRERREDIGEEREQAAGNNEGLRGPPHSPFLFLFFSVKGNGGGGEFNRIVVERRDGILVSL